MTYPIYCLRDLKVGFLQPFCEVNDGAAVRNFSHLCSTPNSVHQFAPADFALFRVGEFDTDTGVVTSCDKVLLMEGSAVHAEV